MCALVFKRFISQPLATFSKLKIKNQEIKNREIKRLSIEKKIDPKDKLKDKFKGELKDDLLILSECCGSCKYCRYISSGTLEKET